MANHLIKSITKSRSGHYTVCVKSSINGRLFIGRKVGTLAQARSILSEVTSQLLAGKKLVLRYDCSYAVNLTNINRYLAS